MAANWTAFVAGAVLEASQLNGVVDNFADIAIFNETQANNTAAGGFTSGSFVKRVLNTTVVNNITGCTLTSSVIALPAGTYSVTAFAPTWMVGIHKLRLQNTTDATTIAIGQNAISRTLNESGSPAILQTVFTLAATKDIELQHRCQTTKTINGLGLEANFSTDEIYATIQINRIA